MPRTNIASLACPALAFLALLSGPAAALPTTPMRCPPETERLVTTGWKAYRADSTLVALDRFDRAGRLCPIDLDAKVGLGYSNLRLGYLMRAESLFTHVTLLDPNNSDGWEGLMSSAWRLGDNIEALRAARRAWQLHPGNGDAKLILDRIYPGWDRPVRARFKRPDSLVVPVRASNRRFEVRGPGGWTPLYVKGVNLGATLPGALPGEFPADSGLYAGWLESIAGMNANAVRLRALLPPDFYRALAAWNDAHPQQVLWLIQGIPARDADTPAGLAALRSEARTVVDATHGAADLFARPGRAGGRYDADVSGWTLGWVLDPGLAPAAVRAYDDAHPGRHMTGGRYLAMADGGAIESWLAARCDELLAYEAERYGTLHPIAYASIPALDPLAHTAGGDSTGIDPSLVRATDANPAGWFASYDAYPFDPECLGRGYTRARSAEGPSAYFGYLRDLNRHHADLPVLITGYGVSSSREDDRAQPQGWTRGGHDEAAQAQINARLTREIRASGCAGGVLVAWMDDWAGRGRTPPERDAAAGRPLPCHDATDAEQNFGVLAVDAGAAGASPELGGDPARWTGLPALQQAPRGGAIGAPVALGVGSDASYVYLAIGLGGTRGRAFGWDSLGLSVALDTYRADLGRPTLADGLARGDVGFELVADFIGPSRAVLRDGSPAAAPGAREPGDERGRLRYGALRQSTLSDWYYDRAAGLLELRLPWALLGVADPSSGRVFAREHDGGELAVTQGDGFRIGVLTWRKGATPRPVGALPALHPGRRWSAADFATWTWAPWEEPEYNIRQKPAYAALKATWGSMSEELSSAGGAR